MATLKYSKWDNYSDSSVRLPCTKLDFDQILTLVSVSTLQEISYLQEILPQKGKIQDEGNSQEIYETSGKKRTHVAPVWPDCEQSS